MKSIIRTSATNIEKDYCVIVTAEDTNEIYLDIYVEEVNNPGLQAVLSDGRVVQVSTFEIDGLTLKYKVPESYYNVEGILKFKITGTGFSGGYITVNCKKFVDDNNIWLTYKEDTKTYDLTIYDPNEKIKADLGFIPLQQGGGTGQKENKIHIGWSETGQLKAQVDKSDLGNIITSGNLKLSRTAVTIADIPSGSTYACWYYPFLGMCFLSMYITGKAFNAASVAYVGTVNSAYLPKRRFALAVSELQDYAHGSKAHIGGDGRIVYIPQTAKEAADDAYITGFWFV